MMLNRHDMVKQFELVVKQEIKNHQETVLATSLAINALNKRLDDLEVIVTGLQAKTTSELAFIRSVFRDMDKDFLSFQSKVKQDANDSRDQKNLDEERIREMEKEASDCSKRSEEINGKIAVLLILDKDKNSDIKRLGSEISSEIDRLKLKFFEELRKTKQEILDLPSEAQRVKEELKAEIAIDKVDFSGVIRELEVYKKSVFVIEKNIENIYTQIERLQQK